MTWPATSRRSTRSSGCSLVWRPPVEPLLEVDFEIPRPLGAGLQLEIHAADLAPVGGLDLHLPLARLVIRLEAVAAEAFRSPAEDLDGNRVLQRPAAGFLLQIPAQLHLVGEARRREDA